MPAAAIPALIGAAGSIGGALLNRNQAGKQSSQQQAMLNQELSAGGFGLTQAGKLGRMGTGALGQTQNYLNSLLGGGQPAMEAAAPEVNTILSQYDTAKKSLSEFAPRGGGTNARMADLPFQESGAITNLLAGERGQAAQSLASLGLGEGSLASSLLPRDSGAGSSLLNYALGNKAQQGAMWGGVGTSIGTLLGQIFKSGGSSGFLTDSSLPVAG